MSAYASTVATIASSDYEEIRICSRLKVTRQVSPFWSWQRSVQRYLSFAVSLTGSPP
ncbi:MAG: hypothetical protein LUQ12_01435 [Methanoregulaceae archaeon]|nr:hypothetical protein [Methanoregulaceae archaeon]